MSRPPRFGPVVTAMVTPFDGHGNLDLDGAATLARWLADHGTDGLVVAGSTGEATALSDDEKRDLWRAVAEAVTIPVLAGSGTADTRHSVELTTAAESAGVAGILAVTPYYSRPSQAGIEAHFRAIAASTRLPVVVYDIPVRSGRKLGHELLVRLAHEVRNVVGVKDASGDPAATARLVADVPEDFDVISGEDVLTLPLLAVGARGAISVESHWAGGLLGRMIAAFLAGQVDEARRLNARLIPSHAFQTGDLAPNPVPTKAMLRVLGLPGGQCRLPLGPAPEGLEDTARKVLEGLGADGPLG
ncbi:MAG TPA: 4-hydroxy-tetrahydrodipicolinate synthase [Acidimicrobiales bacterium]|nr:4-hydroxy-tetrahydrodipicolinate synthase [Acidimicrobiales bacterium]